MWIITKIRFEIRWKCKNGLAVCIMNCDRCRSIWGRYKVLLNLLEPNGRSSESRKQGVTWMWFSASFLGNWKEVLLKQIDSDQLPVYWGGTKTDPDGNEMCTSLVIKNICLIIYNNNTSIHISQLLYKLCFNIKSIFLQYLSVRPVHVYLCL